MVGPSHNRTVPDILIYYNSYIKGFSCPTVHRSAGWLVEQLVSDVWYEICKFFIGRVFVIEQFNGSFILQSVIFFSLTQLIYKSIGKIFLV